MGRPLNFLPRIFAAMMLVLCAFTSINYYFGLNLFGERFDKDAVGMSFFILGTYVLVVIPILRARDYKPQERKSR